MLLTITIQRNVKTLLWLLAVLNAFDAIATTAGIASQLIGEANPMMNMGYEQNIFIPLIYKLLLSCVLIALIPHLESLGSNKKSLILLIFMSVLLYLGIACMHFLWITICLFS